MMRAADPPQVFARSPQPDWRSRLVLAGVLALSQFNIPAKSATAQIPVPEQHTALQPADVLAHLGMDESLIRMVRDGEPLGDDDAEPLMRLLFLIPRLDAMERYGWRESPMADLDAFRQAPDAHRLEMVSVSGRVQSIATIAVQPEIANRFGFSAYFRLELTEASGGRAIELCVRQLPQSWQGRAEPPTDVPIRADAFFLKMSADRGGAPQWTLVADRVAWHPHTEDMSLRVTTGAAILGSFGMDVSLFDDVIQGQPLVQEDREAFYQLLWTVRRLPETLQAAKTKPLQNEFAALIMRPKQIPGEHLRVAGTARRALLVRVTDPDIRARLGIDHYFEVDVVVPLEQLLVLRDPQDGQELRYGSTFPVTLCLAELPPSMPQGDDIRQAIATDAFFLKLRSYRSQFVEEQSEQGGAVRRSQLSPLLVAKSLSLIAPPAPRTSAPGWSLAAVIFGGALGILILRAWYARADRPFAEWRRKSRDAQDLT